MTVEDTERRALDAEALMLTRYLVGTTPSPDLIERYREANRTLWTAPPPPFEAGLVAFVRRHPWSLGCLDAAAALRQPAGRLRGKVLVMSAVLETSPALADEFLPRSVPAGMLVVRLAAAGAVAIAQAALGLLLYPLAVRAHT
jgi:hypothetical protein